MDCNECPLECYVGPMCEGGERVNREPAQATPSASFAGSIADVSSVEGKAFVIEFLNKLKRGELMWTYDEILISKKLKEEGLLEYVAGWHRGGFELTERGTEFVNS